MARILVADDEEAIRLECSTLMKGCPESIDDTTCLINDRKVTGDTFSDRRSKFSGSILQIMERDDLENISGEVTPDRKFAALNIEERFPIYLFICEIS